ncbi:MAG: hypothetical protein GWN01_01220 [Nitrosopumilaceae archaeon]|nr:hypothetical protein [Nitrosopumilaceae archaeon]NIU85980.1 hypothetical protein [Nitrosopumilaceae archaeon]NIX60199.1 hypothetical protein [Nitrosopumilaceae archaeon]
MPERRLDYVFPFSISDEMLEQVKAFTGDLWGNIYNLGKYCMDICIADGYIPIKLHYYGYDAEFGEHRFGIQCEDRRK